MPLYPFLHFIRREWRIFSTLTPPIDYVCPADAPSSAVQNGEDIRAIMQNHYWGSDVPFGNKIIPI